MGRPSTVERLPPDILSQLQALLLDPRCSQLEATQRINAILEEEGHSKISRSAVNRYAQTFEEMTAELVETDRMASLMMAELKISNQSEVGQVTAELLRVMIMKFMPLVRGAMAKDNIDTKEMKLVVDMIKGLTTSQQQLEQSASLSQRRIMQIESAAAQKAREEAAANTDEAVKMLGLTEDTARFLRAKVLQGGV
ncbi:DUF3486 family protein [Methylovulum psychrotolerans]|uniref:DUF3486 domain-containing protein n=1 Tax=Methylovulum psychrotolerans TaxID=1704499 RepID=A0A1Z4C0I8_9GAMM|nr:DUF3486 family protein [Methylovulum psychrotolerans]ASF47009.1 hypothetical protein CEK71_13525 [Methylovulum psychrotolerans]